MKAHTPEPKYVVDVLCEKGTEMRTQKKFNRAAESLNKALDVLNGASDTDEKVKAHVLDELGCVSFWQGQQELAESQYQQSIACTEHAFYPGHATMCPALDHLAQLYMAAGEFEKAEPVCRKSLSIKEKTLQGNHSSVIESMRMCAIIYRHLGKFDDAEALLKKGLAILEPATIGPFEEFLWEMAKLRQAQGKEDEAAALFERALKVFAERSGRLQRRAHCMRDYAELLTKQGKLQAAEELVHHARIALEASRRRIVIEEDETVPNSVFYQRLVYPATIMH